LHKVFLDWEFEFRVNRALKQRCLNPSKPKEGVCEGDLNVGRVIAVVAFDGEAVFSPVYSLYARMLAISAPETETAPKGVVQ
jgi:hypothetical protein